MMTRGSRRPTLAEQETAGHAAGTLMWLLVAPPPAPEQHVLAVEFHSPEGRRWNAIGGGTTVAEAITFARESCPDGVVWEAVSWNDLYGE